MSVAAIEALLERTRTDMSSTLRELTTVASPSYQANVAKEAAMEKVADVQVQAKNLWEAAKGGDHEAIKKLAVIAGLSAAALALIVWRIVK